MGQADSKVWKQYNNYYIHASMDCRNMASIDHRQIDDQGYTLMFWAVYFNQLKTAELFLNQGANPNQVDKYGHNLLHWANLCGHKTMKELLQKYIQLREARYTIILAIRQLQKTTNNNQNNWIKSMAKLSDTHIKQVMQYI